MSVTANVLIGAQFVGSGATTYTAPTATRTIVDKFTATNTDSSSHTITVSIVPSGQSSGSQNAITSAFAIAAGVAADLTELHNQILASGDFVSVTASAANKLVIRMSGREIT